MNKHADYKTPVVIMDLFYGSLQVARSLGRKRIKVYGIDKKNNPIGSYSRYISRLQAPVNEDKLVEYLIEFSKQNGINPIIIPMSDYYVQFLIKYNDALKDYYFYTVPKSENSKKLLSKVNAYEVLAELKVKTPTTIKLTEDTMDEVSSNILFPCILKPEYHDCWLEENEVVQYIGPGKKVMYVNDYYELTLHYNELNKFGELVLQEYVPGISRNLYYYVGYRNKTGSILVSHVANKVRTLPDGMGSETVLRSEHRQELLDLGNEILHKLDYVGPAGIDFKYDPRDKAFKVIEINCRLGLNDCFLAKYGVDISYIYYNDSIGYEAMPDLNYPDNVTWYSFKSDLDWMREYRKSKGLTWTRWLIQILRGYDSYAVFSCSDPFPFVVSIHELILRALKKYGTR